MGEERRIGVRTLKLRWETGFLGDRPRLPLSTLQGEGAWKRDDWTMIRRNPDHYGLVRVPRRGCFSLSAREKEKKMMRWKFSVFTPSAILGRRQGGCFVPHLEATHAASLSVSLGH